MSLCYLCLNRQADTTSVVSKIAVCRRCNDDYLGGVEVKEVPRPVDKAPPLVEARREKYQKIATDLNAARVITAVLYKNNETGIGHTLHLKVWREGGCIFCGSGVKRPKVNKMAHGDCFRAQDEDFQNIAKEWVSHETAT